jgi:DNA-binding HxlR family transcriptional regulator
MKKEKSTNTANSNFLQDKCPMYYAMEQINGRWKILLLWYINLGANRFGKLKQNIPNITTKMLSQQLRELEDDNLLIRTIFAEMPPRVEYALTRKSKLLIPVLQKLNAWGAAQKVKDKKKLR